MKPIEYLYLQMELEGIRVGGGHLITRIHPNVEDFPLVLYALTREQEKILYLDDTIPPELYHKLTSGGLQSFNLETAVEAFGLAGIDTTLERFIVYAFPEDFATVDAGDAKCFHKDDPKVTAFGFNGFAENVYALEQDGKIVSACVSSRENTQSAESWVFTDPDYRRKGLALQVVTAWAKGVLSKGKIPFYSYKETNISSSKVASKLKLVHLFDETVIEKAS